MPVENKKWDEIFRAGTHTDSQGNVHTFTERDLDAIVASYDPAKHSAPLVVGHPASDAPAYGWVGGLKRVGKSLFAAYDKVAPEFSEWVKRGLYRKKSVKLYPGPSLRHVGYLGAEPPAIKGLSDFAFSDEQPGMVFEFSEANPSPIKRMFQALRDLIIEKFGVETADRTIQQWEIDEVVRESMNPNSQSFSEGGDMPTERERELEQALEAEKQKSGQLAAQFSEADARAKAVEAENASLKASAERDKIAARKAESRAFCEGLVKEGKLKPANTCAVVEFMEALSAAGELEFSEDGKTTKAPAIDRFKQFLSDLPKSVEFGEHATGSRAAPSSGDAAKRLSDITSEKMSKNPNLSFAMAFSEAQRENPELTTEYNQALGR